MKESDHWLQLGRVERSDTGLELSFQVVFHDAHVSYPDWEHVLIQSVYQGKELIQVLVLESDRGQGGGIKERRKRNLLAKQMHDNTGRGIQKVGM